MSIPWQVHKFGGTSVGNAERYKAVAEIIQGLGKSAPLAVVVSAMKGVTDKLIQCVELAQKKDDAYTNQIEALKKQHLEAISKLLKKPGQKAVVDSIESDLKDLSEILRGIRLSGIASERNTELVSGYGEVWSAQLLNAFLQEEGLASKWLDARQVLVVEPSDKTVVVNWKKSAEHLKKWLDKESSKLLVITGFVASTVDGVATTLKRNGSDYSASIFGALLEASEITIWTDVDGVFSADPRLVPEAVVLDELSYNETAELAYFGAKVVHPATMGPAMQKGILVWIRNTFNPSHPGTKIHRVSRSSQPVKGFSAIENISLINIEGTGMVGVPGIAERLFSSLSRAGVSVVMISQASSEHSICFAVPNAQASVAKKAVEQAFYAELDQGFIERVEVTANCSILAVVGDNMFHHPGVAGRFFKALGQAGVNVRAIAQGSSERNISGVIQGEDSAKALRAVHSAFYLSDQTLSVGIIGTGLIGSTLLKQLEERLSHLKKERKIDLRIRSIMNSKKMITNDRHISLKGWESELEIQDVTADLDKFVAHLQSGEYPHSVIVDATASGEIPKNYARWLKMGINIITPNKKANTSTQNDYDQLRSISKQTQKYFIYSTNVGAGLPIIQTLRDLHFTGDKVLSIEGILSGTLSYIFNEYNGKKPFSEVVKEAKAQGYTEPDPRDDLSGMDVARKLVILAREMGLKLEVGDVDVQNLIQPSLQKGSVEDFLKNLPSQDEEMQNLLQKAKAGAEVLRYVGTIGEDGKAQVKLRSFSKNHSFSHLTGSENIIAFRTQRYDKLPLIIQGPGAGPQVTAAGVFADILRLASYLGAPL